MKNFTIIAIVILFGLCPLFSLGQTTKFQIGVEGGPSLSTLRYDLFLYPSNYIETGLGGVCGLTFKYNFNNRLALKTSLSYELKGNTRMDNRLNYLTLPILLQLKFCKSPLLFINIGPYFGFLLPDNNNMDNYYKPLDFGASMGLGLEIPIYNQFGLTFEIRNNLGLINVSKNATYNDKHGNHVVEIDDRFNCTVVAQIGFVYSLDQKEN